MDDTEEKYTCGFGSVFKGGSDWWKMLLFCDSIFPSYCARRCLPTVKWQADRILLDFSRFISAFWIWLLLIRIGIQMEEFSMCFTVPVSTILFWACCSGQTTCVLQNTLKCLLQQLNWIYQTCFEIYKMQVFWLFKWIGIFSMKNYKHLSGIYFIFLMMFNDYSLINSRLGAKYIY